MGPRQSLVTKSNAASAALPPAFAKLLHVDLPHHPVLAMLKDMAMVHPPSRLIESGDQLVGGLRGNDQRVFVGECVERGSDTIFGKDLEKEPVQMERVIHVAFVRKVQRSN